MVIFKRNLLGCILIISCLLSSCIKGDPWVIDYSIPFANHSSDTVGVYLFGHETKENDSTVFCFAVSDIEDRNGRKEWYKPNAPVAPGDTATLILKMSGWDASWKGYFKDLSIEDERADSTKCTIISHGKKETALYFTAQDPNYLTYKSFKKGGHKLYLTLYFEDLKGMNIEKNMILIPTKAKKM